MDSEMFTLSIIDNDNVEKIEWPVLRSTGKAVLVSTPGGNIWLPLWKFETRKWGVTQIDQLVALITNISGSASDARIRVWKAGHGPTDKSHKFQVAVRRETQDNFGDTFRKVFRRCFTLPKSQIKGARGAWTAPVWLVRDRLGEKETLARSKWEGLDAVVSQLRSTAELASAKRREGLKILQDRRQEEQRRIAEKQAALEAERNLMLKQLEHNGVGELALEFCRRKFTIAQMRNAGINLSGWPLTAKSSELHQAVQILNFAQDQPTFDAWKTRNAGKDLTVKPRPVKEKVPDKVLENVRVEWVTWAGTSKKRIRIDNDATGCNVAFFGSKRIITLPDGREISKMAGPNLKIHAQ